MLLPLFELTLALAEILTRLDGLPGRAAGAADQPGATRSATPVCGDLDARRAAGGLPLPRRVTGAAAEGRPRRCLSCLAGLPADVLSLVRRAVAQAFGLLPAGVLGRLRGLLRDFLPRCTASCPVPGRAWPWT